MNIRAKRGAKVVFAHPDNGYPHDQELAKMLLEVGKTYTVLNTKIGNWYTDVELVGVRGHRFNSALFEDAED